MKKSFDQVAGKATFKFFWTLVKEGEVVALMADPSLKDGDIKAATLRGGVHYWDAETLADNLSKAEGNPTPSNIANAKQFNNALKAVFNKQRPVPISSPG